MQQTHAETCVSLFGDAWHWKQYVSKIDLKYQTCLICPKWMESNSEVKKPSLCPIWPSYTTWFSVKSSKNSSWLKKLRSLFQTWILNAILDLYWCLLQEISMLIWNFWVSCRYTMTKSSAVLFILFFSLVFKLEEPVSVFIHLIRE